MDILSREEMIAREREVFQSGLTAAALMEAAGEAMTRHLAALYPHTRNFVILVGKGNNGGDGLVVARHLAGSGRNVRVILAAPKDQLGELPGDQLNRLAALHPSVEIISWRDDLAFPGSDGVVIDALLGIQARGSLREPLAGIVAKTNTARVSNFFRTAALDLPTGLAACEDGNAPEHRDAAIVADVTLAVGFAKNVLVREALAAWVGRLEVVPWSRASAVSTPRQVLVGSELAGLLPRRGALSHKGDFGRVAIIGGSPGFTGAPALCAQAALAMGAGLLSVVTRPGVQSIVAAQAPPEAMVSGWPENSEPPAVVQKASALAVGPGLGVDEKTVEMLRAALATGHPLVIDADGLNALAQNLSLLREAKGPVLLTPHPGEMARLIGRHFDHNERESVAREFTDRHQVTLVLKGTRTLVIAPSQPLFINTTGNPGLSTGGSGDTLTGILVALVGQGLTPLDAARLGVWLHGHAADLVLEERGCEEGLTPTMLSAKLGTALTSLRAQAVGNGGLIERARELLSLSIV
ncbi:MAG TPA: NAD(P)H-hydrate dehydratase [Candidatus Methylacidiphilales bacterium]|nr:NAD(P)H-hydrate dehydratase [Candidatus Methylacidiphilales bacterium]